MRHDRRSFLRQAAASIVAPAMPGVGLPANFGLSPTTASAERPNILLMICDDLGYGDLGCYGSAIPTPHLDRLASEGMRCMRHNAAHPICSASRAALLTGRYAPRSHTPGALFPHSKGTDLEEQTLANLFKAQAYQTHAIGKWHLGDVAGYWPTDRGFDSFYGVPYSDDMQPLPLLRNTTPLNQDIDRDELTPRYTEEALRILEEGGNEPFFLYMAYSYPHDPARGSKAFKGRSHFGDFGDAVIEIDASVGSLMEALERTGKARNTVVIFTSDHGPWFQGSPGNTRGRKGSTFEGGVRVPFLIRWPGHVPAASVSQEWSNHLNVLPTLMRWCNLPAPKLPLDGVDGSSVFLRNEACPDKPILYFTPVGDNVIHCVRSGPWKLRLAQSDGQIYINDRPGSKTNYLLPRPELYNLNTDPSESYDVAKTYPEVVARLQADYAALWPTFPADVQAAQKALEHQVASSTTPPGAAPRILQGPLPAWAWEPPDRRGNPL